jgi:hypothetical protein
MIWFILSAMLSAAAAEAQASPPADAPYAVFISPMGEPFRGQADRSAGLQAWFTQADKDKSGWLSVQEVNDDAARFFAVLDSVKDGEIDPDEITVYENQLAPEIRLMRLMAGGNGGNSRREQGGSGHRGSDSGQYDDFGGRVSGPARADRPTQGLKGAGRYGLLNIPEPVSSADSNLNRGVSLAEFQKAATARFVLLDTNGDGKLTLDELQARLPVGRR